MKTVLVTGMSGVIGSSVRKDLDGRYTLVALNRREVPGVRTWSADITDLEAIRPAFAGVDMVVHLAGRMGPDDQWRSLSQINLTGTYNVFESARRAGVRRIVTASSSAVTGGLERTDHFRALLEGRYDDVPSPLPRITYESPVSPRSLYGVTKAWGETLGRYYAETHGMSVICLRFGHVTAEDRPTNLPNDYAIWCSGRDAAQAVRLSLEAPADLLYDIFYVTSANRYGFRDLRHTKEMLGFDPQDSADTFRAPST